MPYLIWKLCISILYLLLHFFFSLQVPFLHLPSHPDCIPVMSHVKMLFLAAQNISIQSSKIIQKPQEKNSPRERTQPPVLSHPCTALRSCFPTAIPALLLEALSGSSCVRHPLSELQIAPLGQPRLL